MSKKTKAEKPKKLDPKRGLLLREKGAELKFKIEELTDQKTEIDAELREFPAGTESVGDYEVELQSRSTTDWKQIEKDLGKKATIVVPEHREFSKDLATTLLGGPDGLKKYSIPLTTAVIYRLRKDADK